MSLLYFIVFISPLSQAFSYDALISREEFGPGSPLPVLCENVVSRLRPRVACEPALGVVPLRRSPSCGAGLERIGGGVVIEHGISPPAAVREPLAVLYHEVHVQQGARTRGIREELVLFRSPVD